MPDQLREPPPHSDEPEALAHAARQRLLHRADARARLRAALSRPSRSQLTAGVLLALLGFGAVTQVRTSELDDRYEGLREDELISVFNGLEGAAQRAQDEIQELEGRRDDLRSETRSGEAALQQAQQETTTLTILAGLVPVTGPGLRITITEPGSEVGVDTIVDTVQELRTAGAEAMEFNDEVRVVAQTSFDQGAAGLLVGQTELSSPYVIDVIGDPTVLRVSGLEFADGPLAQLAGDGAEVEVEELSSVEITSVRNPVQPEYATPVPGQ